MPSRGSPAAATAPAEHLLLVPKTAERRSRAGPSGRPRGGALRVVRAGRGRRARTTGACAPPAPQRRDDMREVATAAGELDPAADRASLAGKRAPDRDEVLALVQFVGPPKDAWVERLRATGARIVTYQAENAYVVHASGDGRRAAGGAGRDRPGGAGGDPAGRGRQARGARRARRRATRSRRSRVARRRRATTPPPTGRGRRADAVGTLRTQYLELSPAEVDRARARPGGGGDRARRRRRRSPTSAPRRSWPGNLNARSSQPSGPGYLAWHDARFPSAVHIRDRRDRHRARRRRRSHRTTRTSTSSGRRRTPTGSTTRPTTRATPTTRDCTGHGTNVASIAGGLQLAARGAANEDAAGFNYGLGVAPLAQIGASKMFRLRRRPRRAASRRPAIASARLRRRRPHLEQLVGHGHGRLGLVHGALAPSTTSSCATPSRARAATSRWSRCSPPATTATRFPAARTRATARSARRAPPRT